MKGILIFYIIFIIQKNNETAPMRIDKHEHKVDPDRAMYASLGAAGGRQVDEQGFPVTRRSGANL